MKQEKFVPTEKLGKKAQKAEAAKRRGSWGNVNPMTRKTENKKAYNRKKARREEKNFQTGGFLFSLFKGLCFVGFGFFGPFCKGL